LSPFAIAAQSSQSTLTSDLRDLVQNPAIPGYEQDLAAMIVARINAIASQHAAKPAFSAKTDSLSDVVVTMGSGAPHRLLVAPMDEPGYVVSRITDDGYLQLQRLPQLGNLPLFNELYAAQPVLVRTKQGKWISGVIAGLSVHLMPQRQHPPSMADLDNMYVDVGAANANQVRSSGVDLLSPMVVERTFYQMGSDYAGAAVGDRFGAAALLELLRQIDPGKLKGTLTIAFVTQQWTGGRGLQRIVQQEKPDELVYLGRLIRPAATAAAGAAATREAPPAFSKTPGSGVLIASDNPQNALSELGAELKQAGDAAHIAVTTDYSAPLLPRGGYLPQPAMPARSVHLSIATAWPSTPGEFVDQNDLAGLVALLGSYLQGHAQQPQLEEAQNLAEPAAKKPSAAPSPEAILRTLSETYGVSGGHEGNVTRAIQQLLPPWAKTQVDKAGNLILHWPASGGGKVPRIAIVAHQDEIGYEVHSILPDGRLDLEQKGGGVLAYYLGHPALVHSSNGMHPGVMELPDGWEKADFQWPRGPRTTYRMDVGTHSPEETARMGIKTGDFVTIPKKYRKLLGSRANARAFDDRVGCASLVAAVWALGPSVSGRDLTFIWSTSEELGLEGASAASKDLAAAGHSPDFVFAVDTFVSSDSPLESPRFADAIVGQGFVVRAVDNSNIVPLDLVNKVVSIARAQRIPTQYGSTNGGNDGAAFLLYGSIDVALGWPLRYSHSPGEVIDVRDLDALSKIITAVAGAW